MSSRSRVRTLSNPDDTVESLKARAQPKVCGTLPKVQWEAPLPSSFTFVDFENPAELYTAMQARPSRAIDEISPNAWVDCGGDTYVLSTYDQSYVKIHREGKGALFYSHRLYWHALPPQSGL